MSYQLQKLSVLFFCLSLAYATVCPTGSLTVTSFPSITGDDFVETSEFYDALYEVKTNSVDGTYTLVGYKIVEVQNLANSNFDVQQFNTTAKSTWKVAGVSQLGNCVVVEDRPSLLAFETSSKTFVKTQNVSAADYKTVIVSDDCSIMRVTVTEGSEQVYKNSVLSASIVFPANSLFDDYLLYGIDSTKVLKKVANDGISSVTLDSAAFEDTPVQILNRKDLTSLIVVTKSSSTKQYTVAILNTQTDKLVFSKSWASGQYSGNFVAQLNSQGSFVLLRDTAGFLLLLKMESTSLEVTVTEITLEKSDYSSLFAESAVISLTSSAVVTYLNTKLTYFQAADETLYYLAQIVSDLETEALKYASLSSSNAPLIPTYIYPGNFEVCYPEGSSSGFNDTTENSTKSVEEIVKEKIQNGQVPVAIGKDGKAVKCHAECLACSATGKCTVCSLGYSLSDSGSCVYCMGCRTCFADTPGVCLDCFKPYVLNETTLKCDKPKCTEANCLSCDKNGNCLECVKGYSVYNKLCAKCQDGCPSCSQNGANTCDNTITTCKSGYVFQNSTSRGVRYLCVECTTGCISCSASDLSNCTSCNEGFYGVLNSDKVYRCTTCMVNCKSCTTGTTCSRCESGFRLSSDKTKCLENCNDNCLTCSETNITSCLTCYAGSQLKDNACVADLSCNAAKTCTACGDGYMLKGGVCLGCNVADTNCINCLADDITTCSKCKYGYYMDGYRACIKCDSSCMGCMSDDSCYSCHDGYYLAKTDDSVTGKCLPCIGQCKTCYKFPYLCVTCRTNFTLDGSKCINDNQIIYNLTVSSDVSQVVLLSRTFVVVLQETAKKFSLDPANPLVLTSDDIVVKRIKKGSAIIEGGASTGSPAQSALLANAFATTLVGTELEEGFTIIGVEVSQVAPETVDNTSSQTSEGTSLGLILGVVIPICLIVLIGIIIMIVKLSRRKRDIESEFDKSDSKYYSNESQKQVNIYSQESDKI